MVQLTQQGSSFIHYYSSPNITNTNDRVRYLYHGRSIPCQCYDITCDLARRNLVRNEREPLTFEKRGFHTIIHLPIIHTLLSFLQDSLEILKQMLQNFKKILKNHFLQFYMYNDRCNRVKSTITQQYVTRIESVNNKHLNETK